MLWRYCVQYASYVSSPRCITAFPFLRVSTTAVLCISIRIALSGMAVCCPRGYRRFCVFNRPQSTLTSSVRLQGCFATISSTGVISAVTETELRYCALSDMLLKCLPGVIRKTYEKAAVSFVFSTVWRGPCAAVSSTRTQTAPVEMGLRVSGPWREVRMQYLMRTAAVGRSKRFSRPASYVAPFHESLGIAVRGSCQLVDGINRAELLLPP